MHVVVISSERISPRLPTLMCDVGVSGGVAGGGGGSAGGGLGEQTDLQISRHSSNSRCEMPRRSLYQTYFCVPSPATRSERVKQPVIQPLLSKLGLPGGSWSYADLCR